MAKNKSLSTQEVAELLHVSKFAIYDRLRTGEIHSYKIGRKARFTQDDVDACIARFSGNDYRDLGKIMTEV